MTDRPPSGLFGRNPMALPDEARLLILRAYMLGQIDGIRQHMVHLGDLIAYAEAAPPLSATIAELRAVPTDMPHDEMRAGLMREREEEP